jgi:glutamine---fructose-6-phosphate transaminase (isomerizing)
MMSIAGESTRHEIFSQPEAWASALSLLTKVAPDLRKLWRNGQFSSVLFTGCGSTYYLSLAAAALMQENANIHARGLPASELWLSPHSAYPVDQKTLLVAISRSGETTETLRAVERFRETTSGAVVTLSCYPDRALTLAGDLNLVLQEHSIAQTRAFSVLYLAAVALVSICTGKSESLDTLRILPDIGRTLLDHYTDLARRYGQNSEIDRIYYLGSGLRYGLAGELSLKMKEMSLSHSEPFHFLEFRHGPQSMATSRTLIVGLVSEANRTVEQAVLDDMRALGAHTLSIGESQTDIVFDSGIAESLRNILYLPIGQLLAFERSLAHGLNPDRPNNLTAVVRLDDIRV